MTNRIQLRRDTAAAWASVNPTLGAGEPALELDTGKMKVGDGTTAWVSLGYQARAADIAAQAASDSATYVTLRGAWTAATAYPKNSLVIQAGGVYLAAADVPARATFTTADWQALGGASTPIADLALTLAGAGVGSLVGTALTAAGGGVGSVNSTLLTSIGGGVGRIAA